MRRASVAKVMTSQYIRTAILKGEPYRRVILRHALRNVGRLIAPFTIIVAADELAAPGVVVVEVFFQYAGFGKLLLDAALFGDVYVIQAATLVAVFVAVLSQIISDVGYSFRQSPHSLPAEEDRWPAITSIPVSPTLTIAAEDIAAATLQ